MRNGLCVCVLLLLVVVVGGGVEVGISMITVFKMK